MDPAEHRPEQLPTSGGWVYCPRWVFRVGMPAAVRIHLVEAMADVEHRLAVGTSEKLQLGALVGAFVNARAGIAAAAT